MKKKESDILQRESKLERMQVELNRLSEQLKAQERDIKDREVCPCSQYPTFTSVFPPVSFIEAEQNHGASPGRGMSIERFVCAHGRAHHLRSLVFSRKSMALYAFVAFQRSRFIFWVSQRSLTFMFLSLRV